MRTAITVVLVVKRIAVAVGMVLTLPMAIVARVGIALGALEPFAIGGCILSLIPGRPGNILRVGYYKLTTAGFASDSYMGFGSFIAKPTARVGRNVSIGAYSIIGGAIIEDDVLIASRCSIMSGKYQHVDYLRRDGAPEADTDGVRIGRSSWIGENCVIMTRVGSNCVVSAGSVVTRPMAAGLTVIGNPARPIRMASQQHPSAAGPDRAVRPPERSEPVKQGVSHDSIRP